MFQTTNQLYMICYLFDLFGISFNTYSPQIGSTSNILVLNGLNPLGNIEPPLRPHSRTSLFVNSAPDFPTTSSNPLGSLRYK